MAQTALWFGVDDLDGTVQEEKIYHMAGTEAPESMTTADLQRLIRAAGRQPVERDTLYNVVCRANLTACHEVRRFRSRFTGLKVLNPVNP